MHIGGCIERGGSCVQVWILLPQNQNWMQEGNSKEVEARQKRRHVGHIQQGEKYKKLEQLQKQRD